MVFCIFGEIAVFSGFSDSPYDRWPLDSFELFQLVLQSLQAIALYWNLLHRNAHTHLILECLSFTATSFDVNRHVPCDRQRSEGLA
jgi:hypothetical protein